MAETGTLELYDHEVLKVSAILRELNEKARHKKLNYNDFETEIKERFADIGLTVDVNWYRFALDGVEQDGAMPEITITGRTEAHTMDRDRQVHEAVSNILELPGQDGWIKTSDAAAQRLLRGSRNGHRH